MILTILVLESLLVYWLSLAKVLISILDKLSQICFSFLWFGTQKKYSYHMINWKTLASPKHLGGWGLKNSFHFRDVLASKSPWRCLFHKGLWSDVIQDKYFKSVSVTEWCRGGSFGEECIKHMDEHLFKFPYYWKLDYLENFRWKIGPLWH